MVWDSKFTGQIIEVNQAYADMLGYTQEELCELFASDLDPDSALKK